ncbi:MAG: hypothetical protein K9N38_11695 [Candidatus Marinimicrobia bacterium]|nr:hypothetical protein [Candidatus Neomarinimicrobiota bacterium]
MNSRQKDSALKKNHFIWLVVVLQYCIALSTYAQNNPGYNLSVHYSYGNSQLLPSLTSQSFPDVDTDEKYSDVWIDYGFDIFENLSFEGALELTDQPHELIATKFSRPDFPLSTGRFQRSVLKYSNDPFTVSFGRDDFLTDEGHTQPFKYPTFGDGFSWDFQWRKWTFKHVFEVMPAEEANGMVFRRSVSYHHLAREFGNYSIGAGEFFILTGEQIGFDLKRLNPFLPYLLNSHDSEGNIYSGFSGDADNAIIKGFFRWSNQTSSASINVYIDEFQIDGYDREVYSDAILISLSGSTQKKIIGIENQLRIGFSVSNPNFGQHPGPSTTMTLAGFPLVEYVPGMKNLAYFDNTMIITKHFKLNVGMFTERWVPITTLSPSKMNERTSLESLEDYSDSRLLLGLGYSFSQTPLALGATGWIGSGELSNSGLKIELNYSLKN